MFNFAKAPRSSVATRATSRVRKLRNIPAIYAPPATQPDTTNKHNLFCIGCTGCKSIRE